MTESAAEYFEVRWRVKDSGENWAGPRRISPVGEIVVTELDRTKLYEFEVRAVSNCGAKSVWVPSDYTVPGAVPPTSVDTLTAQPLADGVHLGWTSIATPAAGIESSIERSPDGTTGWAERARVRSTAYTDPETSGTTYYYRVRYVNFAGQFGAYSPVASSNGVNVGSIGTNASNALADAAAAQADADAANAALADIASDNLLTPGEKPVVIRDYNVIVAEQAGIDAQATAYSITTEKTAYDTAVSALTSYLATLTAPVLWSNLTGNTAIVGATFRSKFADVYTTRQALLNAIYAAAKSKADAAQSTANSANTTANTANSLATQVPVINGGFDATPYGTGWTADAGWSFKSDGAGPGVGLGYAQFNATGSNAAIKNNGRVGVVAGQTYKAQALIRGVNSPNGVAYARISWRDASGTEIGNKAGNTITGNVTAGSFAVDQAPTGAFYASTWVEIDGCTTGSYQVDNVVATLMPSTIDEVPDGTTNARTLATRVNGGKPVIDFSEGIHLNKNLDNIADAGGYVRAIQSSTSETVDNADFEASSTTPVPGWTSFFANLSYATAMNAYAGTRSLVVTTAAQYGSAQSTRVYPCAPGDKFLVSAAITNVINTGPTSVQLNWMDKTGAVISPDGPVSSKAGWGVYSKMVTAPANTVSFVISMQNNGVAGSQAWFDQIRLSRVRSLDTEIADGPTYGRPANADLYVSGGINRIGLRVAGSGQVLGNQLNAPNSLTLNYGAARTTTAVTASSTGAVSINAFSVNMGGTTVSYSAVSNAITGLTQNVTYQIYCHDLGGTGGTKTWLAVAGTANALLTLGDDVVLAGQVTIPASGTSGGGGGGTCVCDNMMIDDDTLAGEAPIGYLFDCLDIPTQGMRKFRRRLQAVEYTTVPCVRITTDAGAILECSTTTPFDVLDGRTVYAPDMLGEQVVTDKGIENVARVKDIGERRVCHIHLGGVSYAAGADPAHRIYSHNLKP